MSPRATSHLDEEDEELPPELAAFIIALARAHARDDYLAARAKQGTIDGRPQN